MSNKGLFAAVCALYWLLGMHFFMHNPGGAGLYLPFNAWGWIFASLVIGLGLWQVTLQQRLVFSALQGWLWLGALLLLLPMAYPGFDLKDYAIPRLLGLFAGLLFLFCLYQWQLVRASRDRLLYLLLGAVAIEALLGLVQYYLLIPGNWLGYDTRANRPYGIFQQPNVMATFMASGLALAGWLELRGNANPWLKGLRYGVILAASLLLVALQSRVGQLGGLLALLLLVPALHRQQRLAQVLGLVALGIGLGIASQYGISGVKRGLEAYQSGGMRSIYWPYAAKLIAQSPWVGWGYGSFETTFLHHYMADKALNPAMVQIEYNLDHPHNEFLYWAVEGGLAPMIGMVLMGGALLWRVSKAGWVKGGGAAGAGDPHPAAHPDRVSALSRHRPVVGPAAAGVCAGCGSGGGAADFGPCQLARVCLSPLVVAALRGHHHSPAGGALHADRHSYRLGGDQVRARRLQGADLAARRHQSHGLVDPGRV